MMYYLLKYYDLLQESEKMGDVFTFSPGGAWPGDSPGSPFEP